MSLTSGPPHDYLTSVSADESFSLSSSHASSARYQDTDRSSSLHPLSGVSFDTPTHDASRTDGPNPQEMAQLEEIINSAAWTIQLFMRNVWQRRVFASLKRILARAEETCTAHLLRTLFPREVPLCRDPTMDLRVRFRLGGETFPPCILCRLYNQGGAHVQCLSGARLIAPGSRASEDACRLMGVSRFLELAFNDQGGDVAGDEPVSDGGRNNPWRCVFKWGPDDAPPVYSRPSRPRSRATLTQLHTLRSELRAGDSLSFSRRVGISAGEQALGVDAPDLLFRTWQWREPPSEMPPPAGTLGALHQRTLQRLRRWRGDNPIKERRKRLATIAQRLEAIQRGELEAEASDVEAPAPSMSPLSSISAPPHLLRASDESGPSATFITHLPSAPSLPSTHGAHLPSLPSTHGPAASAGYHLPLSSASAHAPSLPSTHGGHLSSTHGPAASAGHHLLLPYAEPLPSLSSAHGAAPGAPLTPNPPPPPPVPPGPSACLDPLRASLQSRGSSSTHASWLGGEVHAPVQHAVAEWAADALLEEGRELYQWAQSLE